MIAKAIPSFEEHFAVKFKNSTKLHSFSFEVGTRLEFASGWSFEWDKDSGDPREKKRTKKLEARRPRDQLL